MGRLIEADRLKEIFSRNVVGGNAYFDLIDNAPTVEAIPREKIDEMVAEIKAKANFIPLSDKAEGKYNGLYEALEVIHKYCDKEQNNDI